MVRVAIICISTKPHLLGDLHRFSIESQAGASNISDQGGLVDRAAVGESLNVLLQTVAISSENP